MNPVSNTAFYCCGIRMEDARSKRPVCHDHYAERFMDGRGMAIFQPFRAETMPNISNITRCRIIDDYVAGEINNADQVKVITIGAGFDSRPYRLAGGNWVELDEAQVIHYKNEKLPVDECPNPLIRIPIDFANESLGEKLQALDSQPHTVVVIEGVFMYLEPAAIERTLAELQRVLPSHLLICDLMSKNFFNRFARRVHAKLVAAGGEFTQRPDEPEKHFLENDYRLVETMPMFKRAGQLGVLWDRARIPGFMVWLMLNYFMKDLNGYAVHQFRYA